ncbi:MAG TPA: hypothetical protein VFF69_04300 [Phycisphaerales bacterium]|nr:hypothetical protein [Phycisphaerales bacterium]
MQDALTNNEQPAALSGTPRSAEHAPPLGVRDKVSLGLIAIGGVMLMVFIFRMLRRRPATQPQPERRRPGTPVKPSAEAHDRLEHLMGDAEELTRRLAAILDNKAARLEALIEQADERARRLEALTSRPAPAPPPPLRSEPRLDEPDPADAVDPFHRRVYELADQGLSPVDIARRIDRPTGQVELILALRRA